MTIKNTCLRLMISAAVMTAPQLVVYGVRAAPPLLPQGTTGMSQCGNVKSSTVVRIRIPEGFDTATKLSRVKARDGDPAGEDINGNPLGSIDSESKDFRRSRTLKIAVGLDEYMRNPYHFAMSQIDGLNQNLEYIKVRVFLEDPDYTFFQNDTDPLVASIHGVIHPSDTKVLLFSRMFCQKYDKAIEDNDDNSVLTFYVKRRAKDATVPAESPINLIIIPRQGQTVSPQWGYETPILIDPKIKNDG